MDKYKYIAIVCNYELRPDRIGGMDRFFVAYDSLARRPVLVEGNAVENKIKWFFLNYEPFEFYKDLDISSANGENIEHFFLNTLSRSGDKFDIFKSKTV